MRNLGELTFLHFGMCLRTARRGFFPSHSPAWIAAAFGTPRTTIYEWIKAGLITSASFRKTGQRRGQRLINVQSVRDYIEQHVVSGNPAGVEQPTEKTN